VIASAARSAELTVHEDRSDFLIYPANVVAKRWVRQETGAFIPAMASEIEERIGTPRSRNLGAWNGDMYGSRQRQG
jgi:hypothetical protein